ncbi:hypothetical protein NQ317_010185 [Molorchus minor]|uniref:U6 snRNA-associated Sm-like protein LSm4 n=1 Tax=Molorchus minor TaxID=1323400 RepID=A0ABQ9JYX2_9CUCU|nr:hypothetical protein NQ317_010185 [Molorchus minor]
MLPLSLLRTAQNHPMLVELKNGETYNGHLVSCDNWMNINLREVICTSRDGDKFWRMPECYIRGSTIKYLRIPDEVIDMVKEEAVVKNRGRVTLKEAEEARIKEIGQLQEVTLVAVLQNPGTGKKSSISKETETVDYL